MAVVVRSEEGATEFVSAQKWVIDENEMLHIIGSDGNLASYMRGAWGSVVKVMS